MWSMLISLFKIFNLNFCFYCFSWSWLFGINFVVSFKYLFVWRVKEIKLWFYDSNLQRIKHVSYNWLLHLYRVRIHDSKFLLQQSCDENSWCTNKSNMQSGMILWWPKWWILSFPTSRLHLKRCETCNFPKVEVTSNDHILAKVIHLLLNFVFL